MTQAKTLEQIMDRPLNGGHGNTAAKSPRVISISSGKGGVGKTNIVTNIAYWLARKGKKVLVLDADLNLANVDILLGLTPRYNLHHVFLGEKSLTDIIVEGPGGMLILPASSGIMELADLTESQRLYFLSEMETLGNGIDILLIDTAAGLNNNVIYFNMAAQERIIILNPEPTALTDAYALIKVLSNRHDIKSFRILVNQVVSQKEALSVFRKLSAVTDRFLGTLSLDFFGYIPNDKELPRAVRAQKLVSELNAGAPSSKLFLELATKIAEEEPPAHADGNIKFFWQGLFGL